MGKKRRGGRASRPPSPGVSPGDQPKADRLLSFARLHPRWTLIAATALLLVPFAGKAFHIDDPLFLWAAQHITNDPFDFYGFRVNWFGTADAMTQVMQNPPLASYWLALISRITGWSEVGLHLGFLPFAIAAVAGTWRLARRYTDAPVTAALLVLGAPVFLISATNVMSDVMMLALFVWSVVFWIEGVEQSKGSALWIAAVLAAAAGLTKYFAVALVPLFLAHALLKRKSPLLWLPPLALPVAVFVLYDVMTARMYGKGLLRAALFYAETQKTQSMAVGNRILLVLTFVGGCALFIFFAALATRLRIAAAIFVPLTGLWVWLAGGLGRVGEKELPPDRARLAQMAIFAAAGALVLVFMAMDLWRHRDAESVLLALWIAGTLAFAGYFNWTLNGRAILPIVPPLAVIVGRRLSAGGLKPAARLVIGMSIATSLIVAFSDLRLANAGREAARTVYSRYAMDVDFKETVHRNDLMIIPHNTTAPYTNRPPHRVEEPIRISPGWPASTMQTDRGAGFYSDFKGAMPFVLGSAAVEEYTVLRLGR